MEKLKVLIVNSSPRNESNCGLACNEMKAIFNKNGIDVTIVDIGKEDIRGCIACYTCSKNNKCVFDDIVNKTAPLFEEADGFIIASPVYYASPNGTALTFMDRLFLSCKFDKRMKVGAAVACARRGGTTATFDVLNKYFTISSMPIASSTYWNNIHGGAPGEAIKDEEGMQTIRNLAENMTFLMKSIKLGKEKYGLPEINTSIKTNYIR